MSILFGEREIAEEAASYWWLFLLTESVVRLPLLVFQWDYTTVYAVSYLFGIVAIIAGMNEFLEIAFSTPGWKIVRGILGALFVIAGIWALVHPRNAFATIAALIGFFFLFKGIFDFTTAFLTRAVFDLWWIQLIVGVVEILLAFWVAGNFRRAGDPARRLRRRDRAFARDHGADRRLQAPGPQRRLATCLARLHRHDRAIEPGSTRSSRVGDEPPRRSRESAARSTVGAER